MFYSPLPRTLPAALRDLDEAKPLVRAAAVLDLVKYVESHRDDVLKGLEKAVRDESAMVRAKAAEAVGDAGLVEGIEWLLDMIDDVSPIARQNALLSLGLLKDERALETLKRALTDERPDVRFQATMAYPRVAARDDAVTALLARTRDDDPDVVHIALRMTEELEDVVDERILARARACLRHDAPHVRAVAAIVIATAGKDWADETLVQATKGKLSPISPEDLGAILELVGDRGLTSAREALEARARGGFLGLSKDPCQWHARVALARLGDEKEKKAIMRELSASDFGKRTMAVAAAARAQITEAIPLIEAMEGNPKRADAETVREALRKLQGLT